MSQPSSASKMDVDEASKKRERDAEFQDSRENEVETEEGGRPRRRKGGGRANGCQTTGSL